MFWHISIFIIFSKRENMQEGEMQFISGLCWIDGNKISRKRGKKKTLIFHGQSLSKNGLELMESSFHNGVYLEKRIIHKKTDPVGIVAWILVMVSAVPSFNRYQKPTL